jgi:hypothetical protein
MATLCAECRMPVRPVNECICDEDDDAAPGPSFAGSEECP